ncbi:MAG: DMT family protein [Planctomycetia bacterium]|nr:MAG: DMT family protein [Planctomycetia bacterium]
MSVSVFARTVLLLTISNVFMLTAWYLHLKFLSHRAWYIAALVSWCIAFFEYTVHIPANRIGHTELSLAQLQILQIGMSLILFVPFAVVVMGQPIKTDYAWAALCLSGAAYFIFRGIG